VKKRLIFISAENFKKRLGITRLFFTFRLGGIFNLMGQNFAICPLDIKNDVNTMDNVNRCRNENLLQKQPQLSASTFEFKGWTIEV
jgi:hypothetical protein